MFLGWDETGISKHSGRSHSVIDSCNNEDSYAYWVVGVSRQFQRSSEFDYINFVASLLCGVVWRCAGRSFESRWRHVMQSFAGAFGLRYTGVDFPLACSLSRQSADLYTLLYPSMFDLYSTLGRPCPEHECAIVFRGGSDFSGLCFSTVGVSWSCGCFISVRFSRRLLFSWSQVHPFLHPLSIPFSIVTKVHLCRCSNFNLEVERCWARLLHVVSHELNFPLCIT